MDEEKLTIYELMRNEIVTNQIRSWEEEDFIKAKISKKEFFSPDSNTILKLILYKNNILKIIPYCKKRVKEKIDN